MANGSTCFLFLKFKFYLNFLLGGSDEKSPLKEGGNEKVSDKIRMHCMLIGGLGCCAVNNTVYTRAILYNIQGHTIIQLDVVYPI